MAAKRQKTLKERAASIPLVAILALAAFLIFVNFLMLTSFSEARHVRECHTEALAAAEEVSEDVNAAEYYEFAYRTCMRGYGEVI